MGEYAAVNVSRQSPVSPHRAIRPFPVSAMYAVSPSGLNAMLYGKRSFPSPRMIAGVVFHHPPEVTEKALIW